MTTKKKTTAKPRTAPVKARTRKPVDPVKQQQRELKRLKFKAAQAEIRYEIARDLERETNAQVAELNRVAITDGDVLGTIIAAATALITKHYPTAYGSSLDIYLDADNKKYIPHFRLAIPIPAKPVPTAESLKTDLRRYADANHVGWDQAHIGIDKGLSAHEERERSELLLIEPRKK